MNILLCSWHPDVHLFFLFCIGMNMNRYATNIDNKRVDLFEGPNEGLAEENVMLASCKQRP